MNIADCQEIALLGKANMNLEQRIFQLNQELTNAYIDNMKLTVMLQYLKECAEEELGRDSESWLANEIRLTLKVKGKI